MRMIDLGSQRGPLSVHMKVVDTPTTLDCGMSREVRFRRASFRSIMECVVPCCGFQQPSSYDDDSSLSSDDASASAAAADHQSTTISHAPVSCSSSSSTGSVTGTFFGYRKGRVSLCLQVQDHCRRSCSTPRPLLLLEFTVPTAFLAREMQHGLLRIALVECHGGHYRPPHPKTTTKQPPPPPAQYSKPYSSSSSSSSPSSSCTCSSKSNSNSNRCSSSRSSLFNVAAWSMYCNGRKVGFAIRRQITVGDIAVLNLMQSVSVGAGVLPKSSDNLDDSAGDLMYLRASFERVIGSADSESFHMINPAGSSAQELSIFLLRSS